MIIEAINTVLLIMNLLQEPAVAPQLPPQAPQSNPLYQWSA